MHSPFLNSTLNPQHLEIFKIISKVGSILPVSYWEIVFCGTSINLESYVCVRPFIFLIVFKILPII